MCSGFGAKFCAFFSFFAQIMAEKNIRILHDDCFRSYSDSMQKVVNETELFVSSDRLHHLHEENKMGSLAKVSMVKL